MYALNHCKTHKVWGVLSCGLLVALLLSSCAAGGEPTPIAFQAEAYEPGTGVADSADSATTNATDSTGVESATEEAVTDTRPIEPQRVAASLISLEYTGEIEPKERVAVMAEVGGQVIVLNAAVGDQIQVGQPLIQIDSATLEAQRAQALAGLEAAQAQLDLLLVGADAADIEAARAGVTAASDGYQRALDGVTDEDLTIALAQLRQAEAAVSQAQSAYDLVAWNPSVGALPQSLQLQQATLNLEAAQAQFEKIAQGPTQDAISGAYAQLASARANLQRLLDGPKGAQIRAANAQVKQAETGLYLSQLQLNKATVKAPMSGVIFEVNTVAGAMAGPGTPLIRIFSNEVQITIEVEETRLSELRVEQPAQIRVDAYPGRIFEGQVALIAPELDMATRTIEVTIRPMDGAEDLLPGMFATVSLLE